MLDFTIYSYGYAEIIYHTLQAIAMFRNSAFYTTIITTIALLAGLTYAVQMVAAKADDQWRAALKRVIGMTIFIHALLLPTTSMTIKDNVEKHYWRIDNIPLAFALPIGMVENFGHILTAGFEQVFSIVDGASAHSYYHYGSIFGARLQKEVLQSKVRDPEFINNMSNFIERCVILPSMIGKQFTKEELVASEDLWGLISERAGTFTRTPMTKNGVRVDPHPKCRDAIPYFEQKFNDAMGTNLTSLSWKFKGSGKNDNYNPGTRALNQNIKAQIGVLYKNTSSVDSLLKHNMMINAINSYRSGKYPAAKAQLHNEAGGLISGDLAEKTLTGSLAVMKVIVYGSFIFLFPLLILSGGIGKYRNWITAVFSLALWPSLFSMLNMIIDFAYQPATIVSYSTWSTELKKFDSIASTAANLTLMIPFLSFWITRMGEGGFMHLAGSIMASANSASAALAGEKASGSRNWDNESMRNRNNDNVSSNKHDSSMQYVSGSARSMMSDGSMEMVTPSGRALYFGGSGQSSSTGESSYHKGAGIMANYQQGVRDEAQIMSGAQASYSSSQEKLHAEEASALYSIMQHTKTDNGYNIDTSTEEGREISKHLNAVDELNKTNDYGWKQNAEAHMKADYTVGGAAAKAFGFDAGVGGSITNSNESSQSDSQSSRLSTEAGVHAKDGNNQRTSKTENFLESIGVDKNTQDSIRETYQETHRLEQSISTHQDKIDSYNKAMDYTKSHSSEFSKDMYQSVVDAYQNKHGGSSRQAHEAVSSGTDKAKTVFKELTAADSQDLLSTINKQGEVITSSDNVASFAEHHHIDNAIGEQRDSFAAVHNIRNDADNVSQELNAKGQEIRDAYSAKHSANEDIYRQTETANQDKQAVRQSQVDQYETDRIGKGAITTVAGKVMNFVTDGYSGDSIGRATQSHDNLDLGDPVAKPYEPKAGRSSWNIGNLDSVSRGQGGRHTFRSASPDGTDIGTRAKSEYVDPKKK